MKLSIVSTLYYSSQYIEEFCNRIVKSVPVEFNDFEIILVDDGSPDDSLKKALEIKKKLPQLIIIELSRNFGHHKAVMTGLENATGDFIFLIDSDLEEPPELLEKFWKKIYDSSYLDVVYGVQKKRKGNWFEKWSGSFFYWLYNSLVTQNLKTVKNILTIRLMKKKFIDEFVNYKPMNFFFGPAMIDLGFNQASIEIEKSSSSPTTYKLFTRLHIFLDIVITFSIKPLYFIFYFGVFITLISAFFATIIILKVFLSSYQINGWASIMVTLLFFSGIIIIFLGVISIYLSKIMNETKQAPFAIIKKKH